MLSEVHMDLTAYGIAQSDFKNPSVVLRNWGPVGIVIVGLSAEDIIRNKL